MFWNNLPHKSPDENWKWASTSMNWCWSFFFLAATVLMLILNCICNLMQVCCVEKTASSWSTCAKRWRWISRSCHGQSTVPKPRSDFYESTLFLFHSILYYVILILASWVPLWSTSSPLFGGWLERGKGALFFFWFKLQEIQRPSLGFHFILWIKLTCWLHLQFHSC